MVCEEVQLPHSVTEPLMVFLALAVKGLKTNLAIVLVHEINILSLKN
jgi:hypothetical protein